MFRILSLSVLLLLFALGAFSYYTPAGVGGIANDWYIVESSRGAATIARVHFNRYEAYLPHGRHWQVFVQPCALSDIGEAARVWGGHGALGYNVRIEHPVNSAAPYQWVLDDKGNPIQITDPESAGASTQFVCVIPWWSVVLLASGLVVVIWRRAAPTRAPFPIVPRPGAPE